MGYNGVVVVATLISVHFSLRDISSHRVRGEAAWGKLPFYMLLRYIYKKNHGCLCWRTYIDSCSLLLESKFQSNFLFSKEQSEQVEKIWSLMTAELPMSDHCSIPQVSKAAVDKLHQKVSFGLETCPFSKRFCSETPAIMLYCSCTTLWNFAFDFLQLHADSSSLTSLLNLSINL